MSRKKVEIDDLVSTPYFAPDYQASKSVIQEVKSKSQKKTNSAIKCSGPKKTHHVIKRNPSKKTNPVIKKNPTNKINPAIKHNPPKKTYSESKHKITKKCTPKKTILVNKQDSSIIDDRMEIVTSIETSASCSYHLTSSNDKSTNKSFTNDISAPHFESYHLNKSNSFSEELTEIKEEYIWEQLSILQTLHKKEIELKTTILFEKLKREEEVITDDILLKEKITQLEDEVNYRKTDLKLKETMCSEGQLMETLRWIALPHSMKKGGAVKEEYDFSDGERGVILGHLLRKEQLKRELSSEQLKIAEMEENCRKMKLAIEKSGDDSISEKFDAINIEKLDAMDSDEWKELESLKNVNQKRGARIQLLAKLVQYLIENISEGNLNDDLKILSSACEQIQHWNSEDIDEIEELCKKVYSTKI